MNAEIVEIYIPRRLEYLLGLYDWLRNELKQPPSSALFRVFSLYEVSGAYVGLATYTEQTLVVRLIFDLDEDDPLATLNAVARINEIAEEVGEITKQKEEEIWLIRTRAEKSIRPQSGVIHATCI